MSSVRRLLDRVSTSKSSRTAGRADAPGNGSSPLWVDSISSNRAANSTPCCLRSPPGSLGPRALRACRGQAPDHLGPAHRPALVFQRLWQLTGCQHVIQQLLKGRHFEFAIERAIFLTVLHRLFDPGSDAPPISGRRATRSRDAKMLQLHHLYRAMGWLGDDLPRKEQADKTPFAPRCNKDLIEEGLFARLA